jgi:hypothetical protein
MKCFVIMPFASEFDDVYQAIQTAVAQAIGGAGGTCSRLDDSRPAGRITDRLAQEIKDAALLVADVTGTNPNVMWEVGYAMAFEKPVILVTQDHLNTLPFDLRDMQSHHYDRGHLSATLEEPVRRMVVDTLSLPENRRELQKTPDERDILIGELRSTVSELKGIVSTLATPKGQQVHSGSLRQLEGSWRAVPSGTHAYARMINTELVVAYCYAGNEYLTGAYFGWRNLGERWFANFAWAHDSLRGYAFFRQVDVNTIRSIWWLDDPETQDTPLAPSNDGNEAEWLREDSLRTPTWAEDFFERVRLHGLPDFCLSTARGRE